MEPGRLSRIRRAMEEEGIDVLICRNPENVLYVSGYWPVTGWSLAVLPLDGEPTLIVPVSELDYAREGWVRDIRAYETERLDKLWNPYKHMGDILASLGLPRGIKVGCELGIETTATNSVVGEVNYAGKPTFDLIENVLNAELVDASELLTRLRMVKSDYEVSKMEVAAELAGLAIEKLLEHLVEGVRECELAASAETAVYGLGVGFKGAKQARGFAFVMSGVNSSRAWYPFNISTDRRIRRGDVVLLEFNVCVDGYWVDFTRTWVLGKPSREQEDMFTTLVEAQERVYRFESPGLSASAVDGFARSLIAERGYSKLFPHRLGHGIGLRIHEAPDIHPASRDTLVKGVVHTVEPGLYTSRFGIRLEDVVVVGDSGVRNLFDRFKDLNIRK